jgi:hypothetical protein
MGNQQAGLEVVNETLYKTDNGTVAKITSWMCYPVMAFPMSFSLHELARRWVFLYA